MSDLQLSYSELVEEFLGAEEYQEIETEPFKHDMTFITAVAKLRGEYYMVTYEHSYQNGIEDYDAPFIAKRCKKVTKTVEMWEVVG